MSDQTWIAEYRTEENPGIDHPAFDVIQRLTRTVWPQTPNSFTLDLVRVEGPNGSNDGFILSRMENGTIMQRVFIVDEMASESPWYEEANRMLRLMNRTWRFRLPENNGENPYEVAIRLYHFSDDELKNDSLLEESEKPSVRMPSKRAAPKIPTIPNEDGDPVQVPDLKRESDVGDWVGDLFNEERPAGPWDFLYKDFLCLADPDQYKKTEEYATGVEDFGDKNYGRLQMISRILGGWMNSAEDTDEVEPMLYAIAEKFGMVPPSNWSYGQ